jgi:hypothetical protein
MLKRPLMGLLYRVRAGSGKAGRRSCDDLEGGFGVFRDSHVHLLVFRESDFPDALRLTACPNRLVTSVFSNSLGG